MKNKEITQQMEYYLKNREMILAKAKGRKKPKEVEREKRIKENLCIACGGKKEERWRRAHFCSFKCWSDKLKIKPIF